MLGRMAVEDQAPEEGPRGRGETRIEEPSRAERASARRVAEARATIPDIDLSADARLDEAIEAHGDGGDRSVTAMLVRAGAVALRDHPRANGAYRDGRFELYSRVNIGVVVASAGGLAVPTVFDADRKSVAEILRELEQSAARAAAGELTPPELSGATFTVSRVALAGVHRVTPIITPPHAAAIAAGAAREAPVIRGGEVVAGQIITLTLACDHRILYGERAADFLSRIVDLIEHGDSL
jgi:pyruvate dehydrogenase E2 component (dihydrolipoamide acetyltransferase)